MGTAPAVPSPDPAARPGQHTSASPALAAGSADSPVCIPSERLFGGAQEVQISHQGMRYRLKKTALGKLILTK